VVLKTDAALANFTHQFFITITQKNFTMKHVAKPLKFICTIIICASIVSSCKKVDTVQPPSPPVNTGNSSLAADSLSDRLQFINAKKIQGTIPAGTQASSLKISFKDTFYLMDKIKMPIKFLHEDSTQNVAGIFLQVQAVKGGSFASYYYDVSEVQELDSSDTVSVIIIGIDPAELETPLSFDVTITPYDDDHHPFKQVVKTIKIVKHTTDPEGKGSCGLDNKLNETWDWVMSYMEKSDFTSTPEKIWGGEGQDIQGSCCAGISVYGVCPGEREPDTHLHFNTFYQIAGEQITFYNGGQFDRRTVERGANPLPDSSNFCDPFEGRVHPYVNETLYHGTYTVSHGSIAPDIQQLGDSLVLQMTTQFSDPKGSGYGNGGGVIHYLDCNSLVLIQQDLEGFGQHLYKIYRSSIFEKWYEF
jgi:hypothetical protein